MDIKTVQPYFFVINKLFGQKEIDILLKMNVWKG